MAQLPPTPAPAVPPIVVTYELRHASNVDVSLVAPDIVELPPTARISHLRKEVLADNPNKLRGCDPSDLDVYPPGNCQWTDRSAAAGARDVVAELLAAPDITDLERCHFVVIARPKPSSGGADGLALQQELRQLREQVVKQHSDQAELTKQLRAMQSTRIWSVGASRNSSQSSSQNQSSFKQRLIDYWECEEKPTQQQQQQDSGRAQTSIWRGSPSPTSQRSRSSQEFSSLIKCLVADELLPRSEVTAAHLFPKRHADIFYSTLGLDASKIDSVRNGLLLCRSIENAFDRQRVCFIYNALEGKFIFRVLDPALLTERAEPSAKTFKELNNEPLRLPGEKMPYRRVLGLHAREALAHAEAEYKLDTTVAEAEAIKWALEISDKVSQDGDEKGQDDDEQGRDGDELDQNEQSLNESAVIGTSFVDTSSIDSGFDL